MTSDIYRRIGSKIRELRIHHRGKGISQEELAAEVGTTANTISRWETASYKPSVADLVLQLVRHRKEPWNRR
jgi:transcriptional regulator with XRE-family HTH domain